MPRYDFTCDRCGSTREVYVGYDVELPYPRCCGAEMRKRVPLVNVNYNFPGSTRYRDPGVEAGLRMEAKKYGAPLTDAKAREVLRARGLDL